MKKAVILLFFILFFFSSVKASEASIISINKKGDIIWNILALETASLAVPKQNLLVKDVADMDFDESEIYLNKEGGKVNLRVGEKQELDVTNFSSSLIEIEERAESKKIEISLKGDKFSIEEEGLIALTEYPININPKLNRLSIITPSGQKFLGILPLEAAQIALRSKYLNKIKENTFEINEENKDIAYLIKGDRVINFFNLLKINIPVKTRISASTGEIIFIDQPLWLKILGFVFS